MGKIAYRFSGDQLFINSDAPIAAGEIVQVGDLIGITRNAIVPGRQGTLFLTGTYFGLNKNAAPSGAELEQGKIAWLNPANNTIYNAQNEGYIPIGYVFADAESAATTCAITLKQGLTGTESISGASGTAASTDGIIAYTPEEGLAQGDLVILGSLICVAMAPIPAGEQGLLRYSGECVVAKDGGAILPGDLVYATAAGTVSATSSAGSIPCGYSLSNAQSDDATVLILLVPTGQPAEPDADAP